MAAFLLMIVFVTMPMRQIFAFNCLGENYEDFRSCDQCIQCGANWCTNPKENENHCAKMRADEGCHTPDKVIYPIIKPSPELYYIEGTAKVDELKEVTFTVLTNDLTKMNYTKEVPNVTIKRKSKCYGGECKLSYKFTVKETFCSDTGEALQNFNISVQYNETSTNIGLFHVPCACECSKYVSVNDKDCSGRGNLTCGVCTCMDEWEGNKCDKKKPYDEREYVETPGSGNCRNGGDIGCTRHALRPNVDCSGNGVCDECCKCDTQKDGWQYFNKDDSCEDLCMHTSVILEDNFDSPSISFLPYNKKVLNQTDSKHRRIWVKCNETIQDVLLEYYARKNIRGKIAVMIFGKSDPNAAAVVGINVTACVVPLVLGAVLAMAAAAYYVWHGRGAAPPPSRANYQGLDGPKTRVETNPVYIEPIKSYKNPTYGQNP